MAKFENYMYHNGVNKTWQELWPPKIKCIHCDNWSYLFLVTMDKSYAKNDRCCLHVRPCNVPNEGIWPHDFLAIANYFCPSCGKFTTDWNQA